MSLKKTLTEAASCARHCGSKSHSLFLLGWSFFPLSTADESLCLANYVTCRHGCSVAAETTSPPPSLPEDTSVLLR